MTGDRIAAEALEWIGTPFRWQGRVKGVGCDCKGLVAGVAAACGRAEADSVEALAGDYGARVDTRRLKLGLARLFDRVTGEPAAGDVLLLTVGGKAQHMAIAISARRMVHSYSTGPARVVESAIGRGRVDSVWRWRNVG